MIYWLKEKFESWIGILVVLTVAIVGIASGVGGSISFGSIGFIIGALIGCILSIIYCVIFYGFIATVVCIAKSTEANTKLLGEIKTKLSDLEAIKNKLNETSAN